MRGRSCGFSLLELMVAVGVAMVLVVLGFSLLSSTRDAYERVSAEQEMEGGVRDALRWLARDWSLRVEVPEPCFMESDSTRPADRVWWGLLQSGSAQDGEDWVGDLCAVAYGLREVRIGDRWVRCLERAILDSEETRLWLEAGMPEESWAVHAEIIAYGVVSFRMRRVEPAADGAVMPTARDGKALECELVVARRDFWRRLRTAEDWDSERWLGRVGEEGLHPQLRVHRVILERGGCDGF